jgi:AraC family transcriptional regulator
MSAALHTPRSEVLGTVDRLQVAGYARRRPEAGESLIELTEHAREWIERIWTPLREEGQHLLRSHSARDLSMMGAFMAEAREVQERHLRKLRKWLELPSSPARRTHLRGGLSPAALQRVQVFVEANLSQPIQLADLAKRAELSLYHFARAFRTSAGVTPRTFVEQRRVERARRLISETTQTLVEIAIDAGFGTQSRLTTAFKRRTGFTPGEYRRGRRGVRPKPADVD